MDLTGVIDLHVHTAPDVYQRSVDDFELARLARSGGMRALLYKSHHTLTADRAQVVSRETGLAAFGGLALNHPVGGLNPIAVETAIAFGARQIWMPTIHARHCLNVARAEMFQAEVRKGRRGLTVLDEAGELLDPVRVILEMIRDADIILGTGHLAPEESLVLLRFAREIGLKRQLVTHPLMSFTFYSLDQMKAAVELGAMLEFDALSCCPAWQDAVSPAVTARAVAAVGPRHCVLASDGGQTYNPPPPTMLLEFAESLRRQGIEPESLRMMCCDNPAFLLSL